LLLEKHVIFTWIPSHIGIHGNTVVDQDALDKPISNCSIPHTDFKPFIVKYILKRWEDSWDQQIHNKLHEIHSLVDMTPCSYGQNGKEQVVLTRCRIGHGRLTHSYLLNNEERPESIPCNSNFSLKHVLILRRCCRCSANILQCQQHIWFIYKCRDFCCWGDWFIYKNSLISYVLNIWFYLFNVSFICIYNLIVL
jgi:hypothetical protein